MLLLIFVCAKVYAIEWPTYHRSAITVVKDPANPSNAILNVERVYANSKIECISDWTIEFINDPQFPSYFKIWPDDDPDNYQLTSNRSPFRSITGILELMCEEEIPGVGKCIFALELPQEGDKFYIHITQNAYAYGDITGT